MSGHTPRELATRHIKESIREISMHASILSAMIDKMEDGGEKPKIIELEFFCDIISDKTSFLRFMLHKYNGLPLKRMRVDNSEKE